MRKNLLLSIAWVMLMASVHAAPQGPGALPVISTTPGFTEFETGKGAVIIDGEVAASDADSEKASMAVVKLTNLPDGGNEFITIDPDVVDMANANGLEVNYNFTTGELTITGEADFSIYQIILRKLNYNNFSLFPDIADRLVLFTIYDAEGNASESQTRTIRIKNVEAVITTINAPTGGVYGIGQAVSVTVVFNRAVWVTGGTPSMALTVGDQTVTAVYSGGSGSKSLVFTYVVQEGDLDTDGVRFSPEIVLNGAEVRDSVDEPANLSIAAFPDTSQVLVDGVRPFVKSVTLPADGTYAACSAGQLVFRLVMSEGVTVEGAGLVLAIQLDSGEVLALLDTENSSAETLVFTYTIQSGDADQDGIMVKELRAGEATVADVAANALVDLALAQAEINESNQVMIDGTAPAPPVITGISPDSGAAGDDGVTNTAAISIAGTAEPGLRITVYIDEESRGEVTAGEDGSWTQDASGLGLAEGAHQVKAVSSNGSCNSSEGSEPFAFVIDLTGPTVVTKAVEVPLGEGGMANLAVAEVIETISDNFTPNENISLALSQDAFSCEHIGENQLVVTATDLAGNQTETPMVVTVTNTADMQFVVEDIAVQLDQSGLAQVAYSDLVTGLTGTCESIDSFEFVVSQSEFGCSQIGDNPVTIAVSGPNDFTASLSAMVTVQDTFAPEITGVAENIDIYVGETGTYVLEDFLLTLGISDNCSVASQSQVPAPGTVMTGYDLPQEVKVTAADGSGNIAEVIFTITLRSKIITAIEEPEMLTVAWGTAVEDLPLPAQALATLLSGAEVMVDVIWDIQEYNSTSPGIYQNSGTLASDVYEPQDGVVPVITVMVLEKAPPEDIILSEDSFSVEDDPNAPLGLLTTLDPDDDQHSYALGGENLDESHFYILADRLFWDPEGMPEGQHEFTITIISTDVVGNSISKEFVITRTKPNLDDLTISNVFSPNGDGINDDWGVRSLVFYGQVKLMVFERGGKMVFVTDDPTERWNGRYEGNDLPVGAYYYVIELGEEQQKRRGVLNLIRN